MDKKRLLFVGTQMEVGGSQVNLLTHARWFQQQGHEVTAVFFYDKQGLHDSWQEAHGFPIIDLHAWQPGINTWRNVPALLRGLARLYRLMRRQRPQVVETFTPDSNLLGLPLAWLAGVPARVATHRAFIDNRPGWYPRLHGLLINSGIASVLIAVSQRVRLMAIESEGVQPEKVQVILNGVEVKEAEKPRVLVRQKVRQELGLPPECPLLLTVGRLTEQKGHGDLIKAIPSVLSKHPGAIFAFAGEGPLQDELAALAGQLAVSGAVRFLGVRHDVRRLLQAADVFVLPSLWEGMSMALLEAMAEGTAVIASDVEGISDLIEPGVDGLVVPPRDPAALAAAVINLLDDAELRERLGKAAREKVARDFSVEAMCRRYTEVFWGVLGED
jgi:glycosyltransferase involved in cell wall biosynthesis